ncbi:glycosyltransferase family 2 protein [Aeromicrobium wangtongii]|uniref:Glycosyltransferase n=1 Tax=Aeromicrobium wangtongii TaxID=2969247 RepID=A0ABY5M8A9_9ACTN|nr:glycosyltransferase [Aeromicrobium wangtongii]MCD9196866.1 glycosyltransferase [Aeromicrobium wangtongii]UUP14374.1 glycosyltransferase [Aeromicrobium wangtongii]
MSNDRIGHAPSVHPAMDEYAGHFMAGIEALPTYRSTVGCVIPAYNEEEAIADVLDSLLAQTLLPDAIHVIVNNTTDATVEIASHYAGLHTRGEGRDEQMTEIFVHDIGENPDKKVGALNYGYTLVEGMDYLLGVDGDTTADPRAIEYLVQEIQDDDRIGGISAIYSIDDSGVDTLMGKFLIAGQRAQFAAFNMQNLLRGRNMAVLGGQYSIFSTEALRKVVQQTHQRYPWVRDSEIEDALLSLQIKSAGYLTKISARARANVGGMNDMRSLDAQQVKWNTGGIDLMWPGQRGDTKGQPLHPNLRLRWFENFSMVINGCTRWMFFFLLISSLILNAFVFLAFWLVPTIVATLLNLRIAHSMESATRRDYLFALLWVPAELYMWIRLGHFARSWTKFFSSSQTDNWALQARAESGSGGWAYLSPIALVVITLSAAVAIWTQLSEDLQSTVLLAGWTSLGIITILQTAWLAIKLCRRYKGFTT